MPTEPNPNPNPQPTPAPKPDPKPKPEPVDNPETPDFGPAPQNTEEARAQSEAVLKHSESMKPDPSQEGADAIKAGTVSEEEAAATKKRAAETSGGAAYKNRSA